MFTKLFDKRTLPVLARALLFAIAAAVALLWLPVADNPAPASQLWYLPQLSGGGRRILWVISIPLIALLVNEIYYRYQVVPNNYQLTVVLPLVLGACFGVQFALVVVVSVIFGTWFFAAMLRSYRQESARFSAFDLGMLSGLAFIFNAGLLVLLLLSAIYILLIGNGRIKVFIALILGFGVVNFLTFCILELSGFHQMALRIPEGLIGFHLEYGIAHTSPVPLMGAGFLAFVALIGFLGNSAAMTVYERVMFSSFSLWVMVLWPLALILNHSSTLLALALLFSSLMIVFLLYKVQNRWLRDGIYLVLLLMYAWPWYAALV